MDDALGLASGSGSVENEEGVLRRNGLGWAVGFLLFCLFMPPHISALDHVDLGACSSEDEDVFSDGCFLERCVCDALCGNGLSASLGLVGGDEDLDLAIGDSLSRADSGEKLAKTTTWTSPRRAQARKATAASGTMGR